MTGLADKFARPLVALQPDILSPAAGSGLPDANGHGHSALEAGIEQFIPLNMFESAHRGGAMRPQLLHQHLHERQKNRAQFHKVHSAAGCSWCTSSNSLQRLLLETTPLLARLKHAAGCLCWLCAQDGV